MSLVRKDRMNLERVVLIGRRFWEYERFFGLADVAADWKIADIGGGVSSFCAEACESGLNVMAIDPIYGIDADKLETKCEDDLKDMIRKLSGIEHLYLWNEFKDKPALEDNRRDAYRRFIGHYRSAPERYIHGALPSIEANDQSCDLALVSHLLFLYDHILDEKFHRESVRELMRIARREIRIFPIVSLSGYRSPFVEAVIDEAGRGKAEILKTNYMFIRGGDEYLKISKY